VTWRLGPQDLQGMTWSQVGAALRDPSSAIAQEVIGQCQGP
jgi:hypothetical protein